MEMRKIDYYVATSVDGFIAGPNEDVSGFIGEGEILDKYNKDLLTFDTVIMGRKTYEFGYKYGLVPGKTPYGHMKNYIFSNTLNFDSQDSNVFVKSVDIHHIIELKKQEGTNIYLCGGAVFAGWLLRNKKIDLLTIKLNPFVQGKGVKLFEELKSAFKLNLLSQKNYNDGLMLNRYEIMY